MGQKNSILAALKSQDSPEGSASREMRELSAPPSSHKDFRANSTWMPDNNPTMIETMVEVDGLFFDKTKSHAPVRQNLSKAEKRAIRELQNNPDIIIKNAYRGSAIVMVDKDDYIEEGLGQLNDIEFYKHVDFDHTHDEFNNHVKNKEMLDRNEITCDVADCLV